MFFFTYLWAELRRRIRQALLIALGLAFGIGMVISMNAITAGVGIAQGKVLQTLYGLGTDITVTTPFSAAAGPGIHGQITPEQQAQHFDALQSMTSGLIDSARVTAIAGLHGVAGAAGGLVLTESKSTVPGLADFPPPALEPPVLVSVIGVDVAHLELGPFSSGHIIAGRTFGDYDANADNAVLSSNYADAHGLSVGSRIVVSNTQFTVVGILSQTQDSNPADVYISLTRAQALSQLNGYVNTVYVKATSAASVAVVARELSNLMPSARVSSSSTLAAEVTGSLATAASLASTLGKSLAVLALSAAFGAASLLTLGAVSRRAREFGTLKALGWPDKRIITQLIGESIAIGLVGAALGVALGFAGSAAAAKFAPSLSATVQESNSPGPSDAPGANGGFFSGTVGGSFTTIANPNVTHTVAIPFTAPVGSNVIEEAVILALAGAVVAGALGGWRIARLRPAVALARLE